MHRIDLEDILKDIGLILVSTLQGGFFGSSFKLEERLADRFRLNNPPPGFHKECRL